ncbi:MAG: HlyD family type I secretion periplasmic adaptor subunit [Pseudomonadota bacterium]
MKPLRSPTLHITLCAILAAFFAIIAAAVVFRVEVVARGEGKFVPSQRIQEVQPEFDGKVLEILVENGSVVEAGRALMVFNREDSLAERRVVRAEVERLTVEDARLERFIEWLDGIVSVTAPPDTSDVVLDVDGRLQGTGVHQEQTSLLQAQLEDVRTNLNKYRARQVENERSIDVTVASMGRIKATLDLQRERLDAAEALFSRGTASRSVLLEAEESFVNLSKLLDVEARQLALKQSTGASIAADAEAMLADLKQRALLRRSDISERQATLAQQEAVLTRRIESGTLRAPSNGVIDKMSVYTIGAFVEAGVTVLHVVPLGRGLELEAVFPNQDAGFISVGQTANLRLAAYPAERYGLLKAEVVGVSADAVEMEEGRWGYTVRLRAKSDHIMFGGNALAMRPGMTATADIITEERRLISYFFEPIVKTFEGSLGER